MFELIPILSNLFKTSEMDKRDFLKAAGLGSLGVLPFIGQLERLIKTAESNEMPLASNEDFWAKIRQDYILKEDYINLEGGYYCMTPEPTLTRQIEHIRMLNREASYYMRTVQWENKKRSTEALAKVVGAKAEEICITRNTTESLDLIIGGYPWKSGDEALMANQDYGAMLNQFKMAEKRFAIQSNTIDVPMDPSSDEEIVKAYEKAITPKTKLLMICHVINITGQILPVQKICQMAHKYGVEVMVDGAHAVGHFPFSLDELDCDYYGSSLHKWLSVPLGAGMLYVKQEKIDKIWPLMAEGNTESGDIRRLNHIGTHPCSTDLSIIDAIDYYETLGPKRKEKRLRYLQNYWVNKVRQMEHVIINTPSDPKRSCAIANIGIKGLSPREMSKRLMNDFKIWTVAIDRGPIKGCRITPNVYTTTAELDAFVNAVDELKT